MYFLALSLTSDLNCLQILLLAPLTIPSNFMIAFFALSILFLKLSRHKISRQGDIARLGREQSWKLTNLLSLELTQTVTEENPKSFR